MKTCSTQEKHCDYYVTVMRQLMIKEQDTLSCLMIVWENFEINKSLVKSDFELPANSN